MPAVVAGAVLVAACGSDGPEPATVADAPDGFCVAAMAAMDAFLGQFPDPAGERYGGTAVAASYGEFADGMSAFTSPDYVTRQHQNHVNLMTLVQLNEALEPIPYLAESWDVNEAGAEIVFHLRDDVFWHDGVKTTAYDVEFTFNRASDPETPFPNPGYWTNYGEMEVVDSFTVRLPMTPRVDHLDSWRATAIMPRHLLEDVPSSELANHPFNTLCPVGNGPFAFVEHRQDESWTFRRNPAFPEGLGGPPFLDRYVYRVILDQTALLTELLTEGIDIYNAANPDQADEIMEAANVDLLAFPFRQTNFVAWNSRRPQLSDRRVRRALTLATNRRAIVDALVLGYGNVANATVPLFHWSYDKTLDDALPYDPDEARSLLDEAGWMDRDGDGVRENEAGEPLSFSIKSNDGNQIRNDIAELMQAQLADVGVEVQPLIIEWNTLLQQVVQERDYAGLVFGIVNDFRLDDTDLFHSDRGDAPLALSGTANPEIDRLLEELEVTTDREEALPLWRAYQQAVVEEQPYTFVYFNQKLDGVNRRVQDVEMDVRGEWLNVRHWWIPADQRKYSSSADR